MAHHEIPIKVTAWVDEGVAPLVSALSEFPEVQTLDSCQCGTDGEAYVFFARRGDRQEIVRFAADFAAALAPHDDLADYSLTAEWRAGTDEPVFRLACPQPHIARLAAVLSEVVVPADGRYDTALRS